MILSVYLRHPRRSIVHAFRAHRFSIRVPFTSVQRPLVEEASLVEETGRNRGGKSG